MIDFSDNAFIQISMCYSAILECRRAKIIKKGEN